MKTAILIGVMMILVGCDSPPESQPPDWKKPAIEACINQGGIPILSSWDGRLLTCQFPPTRTKGVKP